MQRPDGVEIWWFHVQIPLPLILLGAALCAAATLFLLIRAHRRRGAAPPEPRVIKRP